MTYRDDRDALKSRVEELERELAGARRRGEQEGREAAEARAGELQGKLVGLRGELDRMEAELRELRRDKEEPGPNRAVWAVAAVPIVLALIGGIFVVFVRRPPPRLDDAPPRRVEIPNNDAPPEPSLPELPAPTPAPPPKRERPEPAPMRSAKARWRATVKSAQGAPVAPGSTCFVDAVITTRDTNTGVPDLSVTCGSEVIYSTEQPFNGVAQMGNDALERLGPTDEKSTFTLQFTDMGTRSGRPQIDLDTKLRQGVVFRDNLPKLRVELSLPIESEPTAPLAGPEQRLRRPARVTEVSGLPALKVGTECILRAMPTGQKDACVAEVSCGATRLFPVTSPVKCAYEDGRPVSVASAGGPYELSTVSVGLTTVPLVVKGSAPRPFTVTLTFDPRASAPSAAGE